MRRPRLNAIFALILLSSAFPAPPAAYSHHPCIASQVRHTPHATASDVVSVPAYILGITAAATATAAGLSGVAAAFFGRVCNAHNCALCFACVSCRVDFGHREPRATPARVLAAQAWSGGGLRACQRRRERQRRPGRAAARVRSVVLCVRPISAKKCDVYEIISRVHGGVSG